MASDMFLYWGSGSGPCFRVMIALEEKGLHGYPNKLITFSNKEHKSEEILKLNPRGQVPTFRHGDIVVNESIAACEYLESVFAGQGTKLIPEDKVQKAKVLQRAFEALNLHKKGVEELTYYIWKTKEEDRDAEVLKTKKQALLDELAIWEGYLKQEGEGAYLAGKEFTMADVYFFPTLAFLTRIGLKTSPRFPHLAAYYNLVAERPSVKASWPPHWKDSPNQTQLSDV